jgi:hypothetical protein
LSITGNSYNERVNLIGAMEKANYWKSLEGPSRWWTHVDIVSFPLAAESPLTQEALLSLGLCTLVTSGTIFTPAQITRAMAMYLLRDCFDDSIDGAAQDVAVAYLLREKHQNSKTDAGGDLPNNPSLPTRMPTIDDGHVRLEV